jgi:ABC-2 type transport system permease protein
MIANISTISGVFLIATRFEGIGGMSADEILFMMAYSTLVTGIFVTFGAGNNFFISRIIGRGQLEHLFIQPLSLATQLSTNGFQPFTGGGNLLVGGILMAVSLSRLDIVVNMRWAASLLIYLLATVAILIARSYLVSCFAFYSPVAAEEISSTAIDGTWFFSTFPLSGMPGFIRIPLLTIMPEGLMAWFPSLCLLGKPPFAFGGYYPVFYALLISLITGYVFSKGLRYYVQKGSNRYVSHGFRR